MPLAAGEALGADEGLGRAEAEALALGRTDDDALALGRIEGDALARGVGVAAGRAPKTGGSAKGVSMSRSTVRA